MADYFTPKGTRDFLPEEMRERKKIFKIAEETFEAYGFRPMETPAFEEMNVLAKKSGEEIKKEIYEVTSREETKLGLRFDLTVPMARAVASNPSLTKPFKRYCIGPVWRCEDTQRGRYREFWQADIDTAGSKGMEADAEAIACACAFLEKLDFKDYIVKINNRKAVEKIKEKVCAKARTEGVLRALDKMEKRGRAFVKGELVECGLKEKEAEELLSLLESGGSNEKKISEMKRKLGEDEGLNEIAEIIGLLKIYGLEKKAEVDFSLARGLDYYTGPVFEIIVPKAGVGTIAAGGRYDKLIGLYGKADVPCTGISLGIERIIAVLGKEKAPAEIGTEGTRVLVVNTAPELYGKTIELAEKLRKKGMACECDVMKRKISKNFEYANARGIPFVAVIGPKEVKAKKVTLREMRSGKEEMVSEGEAEKRIKAQ